MTSNVNRDVAVFPDVFPVALPSAADETGGLPRGLPGPPSIFCRRRRHPCRAPLPGSTASLQEVIQRVERVHFALVPDPQAPREDDRAHRVRQTGDGPIGDILAARAPPHAVEPHHETQDALDFLPPSVGAGQHHRLPRGRAAESSRATRKGTKRVEEVSASVLGRERVPSRGPPRVRARELLGSPRHTLIECRRRIRA